MMTQLKYHHFISYVYVCDVATKIADKWAKHKHIILESSIFKYQPIHLSLFVCVGLDSKQMIKQLVITSNLMNHQFIIHAYTKNPLCNPIYNPICHDTYLCKVSQATSNKLKRAESSRAVWEHF